VGQRTLPLPILSRLPCGPEPTGGGPSPVGDLRAPGWLFRGILGLKGPQNIASGNARRVPTHRLKAKPSADGLQSFRLAPACDLLGNASHFLLAIGKRISYTGAYHEPRAVGIERLPIVDCEE